VTTRASDHTPVYAVVYCQVRVNGVAQPPTDAGHSGYGVQPGADQIPFTATPRDVVTVCQRVEFDFGAESSDWTAPRSRRDRSRDRPYPERPLHPSRSPR
jgi:hypothetical protein